MWHQPISLDMKREGLPCVWSGGRQLPRPSTTSLLSFADCLPLSHSVSSSSASPGFCLPFGDSSSLSSLSSASLLCLSLHDLRGWLLLPRTMLWSCSAVGCWGILGSSGPEGQKKRRKKKREETEDKNYLANWVTERNQTLKSFIPRRDIHDLKSVTKQLLTWKWNSIWFIRDVITAAIICPALTSPEDVIAWHEWTSAGRTEMNAYFWFLQQSKLLT